MMAGFLVTGLSLSPELAANANVGKPYAEAFRCPDGLRLDDTKTVYERVTSDSTVSYYFDLTDSR